MDFFPIFLNLNQSRALVVGGGDVAARKINLLLNAGARVDVIAPQACDTVSKMADDGMIRIQPQAWSNQSLDGYSVVIAATDDAQVNRVISESARQKQIPVNVVDQPGLGSFIMPSIVDRSPVIVAVSTGGASPVLARLLRSKIESLIPSAYGRLARLVEKYRRQANAHSGNSRDRRRFWENILQGKIAELVFSGREQEAEQQLQQAIASDTTHRAVENGDVWLVGAGPGDPDLLTFRALRLMQQAEVVLYDRLVSQEVLNLVRRDADKIYVGKEKADHSVPQAEINQYMIKLAREGKRVLRLKGGDPFIFGRGGEEIEDLFDSGITFQVVPGITAAAGCAAYSGIPLTHRNYSQSCVFVTGHLKDGSIDLNWNLLTQPNQTVVIYMGLTGLDIISEQMITHGTNPDMPAALIQKGTTREQRVLTGTIKSLPTLVADGNIKPPTLVIIGEVVSLRDKLSWFNPDTHAQ